jgi:hypothetical protein
MASDNLVEATYTAPMAEIYRARLDANRRAVDEQFHACKADNESIYFDGVPTRDRLEIPQGRAVDHQARRLQPPEVEAVSFASKDVEKEAQASAKPAPSSASPSRAGSASPQGRRPRDPPRTKVP